MSFFTVILRVLDLIHTTSSENNFVTLVRVVTMIDTSNYVTTNAVMVSVICLSPASCQMPDPSGLAEVRTSGATSHIRLNGFINF